MLIYNTIVNYSTYDAFLSQSVIRWPDRMKVFKQHNGLLQTVKTFVRNFKCKNAVISTLQADSYETAKIIQVLTW